MNYLMTVEAYGRHETKIDLNRFVADLAKELGGKVCKDPERDFGDQSHIVLGTERLDFYANNYGSKGRVRVSIWAPDVKHDERGHYNDKCKTVTATVNPNGRTMAAIAKDIKKRVVDGLSGGLAVAARVCRKCPRRPSRHQTSRHETAAVHRDQRHGERERTQCGCVLEQRRPLRQRHIACGCHGEHRSHRLHSGRSVRGDDVRFEGRQPMTVHKFRHTGEAYDACQCDEKIKNGDLLVVEAESVVGVAWTWPFAVTAAYGVLHKLITPTRAPGRKDKEGPALQAGLEAARRLAQELGYPLQGAT